MFLYFWGTVKLKKDSFSTLRFNSFILTVSFLTILVPFKKRSKSSTLADFVSAATSRCNAITRVSYGFSCGSPSDCWRTSFANDAMHVFWNSSVVCIALWPLLPWSQWLQTRTHFSPTLSRFALMFLAPLRCSWHALVAGCWDASRCQWVSNCSKVRCEVPRVL